MLGEVIGESRGKRTARRVLSVADGFTVEVPFETTDKLLGIDTQEIGTYWSESRPDGTLYGEGQGVIIGADGNNGTWRGQGVGKFVGEGKLSYRGAIYFSTASPKLARLNEVAAVFEFDVDAEGNTHSKLWEWKKPHAAINPSGADGAPGNQTRDGPMSPTCRPAKLSDGPERGF